MQRDRSETQRAGAHRDDVPAFESSLPSELGREVVLERELDLEAVALEAVGEILVDGPTGAPHPSSRSGPGCRAGCPARTGRHGMRRGLCLAVVVVLARVADRAGELLAPGVIEKQHEAGDGDRLAENRPDRITEVVDDADVHGRVVHVVLDAFAEHVLEAEDVAFGRLEVGTQIEAPARGAVPELDVVGRACRPT